MVQALAVLREVSPRTLDVIAAMGELLSSRIVAAALNAAGVEAEWVDARRAIVTSADHMRATPLTAETARALRATVVAALDAKRVPVLGGFVGATVDGHTTTLGRGGSDYSGALVGAGIGAREIQIWTDVDGMLTADPRVIAEPRLVPRSCRSPRPRSSRISAPRCCTRARSCRPSSATFPCASSTRCVRRAPAR